MSLARDLSHEEVEQRLKDGWYCIEICGHVKWLTPRQEKFCQLLASMAKRTSYTLTRLQVTHLLVKAGYTKNMKSARSMTYYYLGNRMTSGWIKARLAELGINWKG